MEVGPSKQLHRHIPPIIVLAASLLIVSLGSFSTYALPLTSQSAGRAFVTNLISVKASSSGSARISFNRQAAPSAYSQSSPHNINDDAGTTAQLTVNLFQP